MAANDIYQVVLNYVWNDDVECKNVFYYQQTDSNTTGAQQLNTAFAIDTGSDIIDLAPDFIKFYLQEVVNLDNPTDFFVGDYGGNAGDRTPVVSDAAPPFLACQFVGLRAYPGTRNNRKRFPFLYEADIAGRFLDASYLALAEVSALQTSLAAVLSSGGRSFRPVVVERPVHLGTNPPVRYVINPGTVSISDKVSTQNSRKD